MGEKYCEVAGWIQARLSLPFRGPPIYVFEDPEPNGESVQDSMMPELDYRNLHVHIELCVCVWGGGGGGGAPMCLCAVHSMFICV